MNHAENADCGAGHLCRKPRWRRSRHRHSPWVCACGRAWLSRFEIVHFATGGGLDVTRWTWVEWRPRKGKR